jgi:hypothetical protein
VAPLAPVADAPQAPVAPAHAPASFAPRIAPPPVLPPVLELAEVRFERPLPWETIIARPDGTIRYDYGKIVAKVSADGRFTDAYGKEVARLLADGTLQGVADEPVRIEANGDARGGASSVVVHVDERGAVLVGGRALEKLTVRFASSPPSPAAVRFAVATLLGAATLFTGEVDKTIFDDPRCEWFRGIGVAGARCECKRELDGRAFAMTCNDGLSQESTACTCTSDGAEAPKKTAKPGVCDDVHAAWAACGFAGRRLRAR